jgi:hypothetical protein
MRASHVVSVYHIKKWRDEKKALKFIINMVNKFTEKEWKWSGQNIKNDIENAYKLWYSEVGKISKKNSRYEIEMILQRIDPSWFFLFKVNSIIPRDAKSLESIIDHDFSEFIKSEFCEKLITTRTIGKNETLSKIKRKIKDDIQASFLKGNLTIKNGNEYYTRSRDLELIKDLASLHFNLKYFTNYRDRVNKSWFENLDLLKKFFKFRKEYLVAGNNIQLSSKLLSKLRQISLDFSKLRDEFNYSYNATTKLVWKYFEKNLASIHEKPIKNENGIIGTIRKEGTDKRNFINDFKVSIEHIDRMIARINTELNTSLSQYKLQKSETTNLLLKSVFVMIFFISVYLLLKAFFP